MDWFDIFAACADCDKWVHVVDSQVSTISSCQGCLKVTWLWAVTRRNMVPTG